MPWFQLKFLQGLNLLELAALTASDLMELLLCLGVVVNYWCGMQHEWVRLLPLTCLRPPEKQEQLLPPRSNVKSPKIPCTVSLVHPGGVQNLRCNGPRNRKFFEGPWVLSKWVSGDDEAYIHLLQRFSIAIQRGNCASALGSTGVLTDRIPDFI